MGHIHRELGQTIDSHSNRSETRLLKIRTNSITKIFSSQSSDSKVMWMGIMVMGGQTQYVEAQNVAICVP
jgi:hypothetical protein